MIEILLPGAVRCDVCGGCTGVHVAGCPKMDSHVVFYVSDEKAKAQVLRGRDISIDFPELDAPPNRHERRKAASIARRSRR